MSQAVWRGRQGVSSALVVALAITACAQGPTSPETTAAPTAVTNAVKTATPDIPEFVLSTTVVTASLDTAKTSGDVNAASLVNENLESLRVDGTFMARAAVSANVGREKIVYQIRPGMKFSDGSAVTVDDVVFSIERAIDPKRAPALASPLSMVASAAATGPNEVAVTLKAPNPVARAAIAFFTRIWKKTQVETNPEAFGSASALPIGSGPYRAVQLTASEAVFERNEDYWGQKPPLKKVRLRGIADESTAQLAMRSNEIGMRFTTATGSGADWKAVPGATVIPRSAQAMAMFSMDTSKPPLDDVHVRRAIAYSIDKTNLTKVIYGEYAEPLKGFMSAETLAVVASATEAQQFLESLPQYPFDPAKAKAEIAQSRYPSGFTVDAFAAGPTFPHALPVLQNLQRNMSPLGVTINIRDETFQQWGARLGAHKELGLFAFQIYPVISDPAYIVTRFFGKATLTGSNTANWAPPELEESISLVATSTEKSARFSATKAVLGAVANDVPWLPLFSPQLLFVIGKGYKYDLTGSDRTDIAGGLWIWRVSIAQ